MFLYYLFFVILTVVVSQEIEKKCEYITVSSCTNMPYNRTMLPNIRGHTNQNDAAAELRRLSPLVSSNCHSDIQFFLCSIYVPECTSTREEMFPCRNLCERIRNDCEPLINMFGYSWPSEMDCSIFPKSSDKCIDVPQTDTQQQCQPISTTLCYRVPYKQTIMPNILNHKNQAQAFLELIKFSPLVKINCSSELRLFLCSVYFPKCTSEIGLHWPCKNLCYKVKSECAPFLDKYGISWPSNFECSMFPDTSDICVDEIENEITTSTTIMPIIQNRNHIKSILDGRRCEPLRTPVCKQLPYNQTSMPNILKHQSQELAALEIMRFLPLIQVNCHRDFQLFLCSIYFPKCTPEGEILLPCESLCTKVRAGCEPLVNSNGYSWPSQFKCSIFPNSSDHHCIESNNIITV